MPSRLETLQREFTASITGPRARKSFVRAVRGGGRLNSAAAVEVYRRGYPARMSEALGETYEACWRALGDADFLSACEDYSRRELSRSPDLADYGRGFPAYLQKRFRGQAPWIGELGRLCWEFKNLFHAKPQAGLPAALLAAKARPSSRFTFVAPRRRLTLKHRVHAVWARDRADETPIDSESCRGVERLLLYKSGTGQDVYARTLSPAEDKALAALEKGERLETAAAKLTPEEARGLFAFLGASGLVASLL